MDKNPKFREYETEKPKMDVKDVHKLPEWVKCYKCGKPPIGYNWLRPVSNDFNCKQMIHLDCIKEGLSREFANQSGGHRPWQR